MTDKQFFELWMAALAADDRDVYVSDWTLSSLWADDPETDIPPDRAGVIGGVWDVAHMTIRDILEHTGLTQAAFSVRYCIPLRTVENWVTGKRSCPDYVRLLLAQVSGAYDRA